MADLDTLIDEFGLDPEQAIKYLLKNGYCLQDDLCWLKPEVYYIPTAKEVRAVDYLWQAHDYKLMYSVDIKKPIKRMCELKDSTLLKAHINLEHGKEVNEKRSGGIRTRDRPIVRGRTQKDKVEKTKRRV
jgi:hypothetical protein